MRNLSAVYFGPSTRVWKEFENGDNGGGLPPPAPVSPRPESAAAAGKLAPYLQALTRQLEDRPRAKIKDHYLALCGLGYQGSYDLVKKKIHSIRKEKGRQAALAFSSPELPQAQVELVKILLKGEGRETRAYLFTMALGHSGRFHAELFEACDMVRFLQAHRNAFQSFGGAPSGVFYNLQNNPLMRRLVGGYPFHLPIADCGLHYGYRVLPTPVFAPWMIGRLTRPSKILRKRFLSGRAFATVEAANRAMQEWLASQAGQSEVGNRMERTQQEKLRPLPATGFDLRSRRPSLKLLRDAGSGPG